MIKYHVGKSFNHLITHNHNHAQSNVTFLSEMISITFYPRVHLIDHIVESLLRSFFQVGLRQPDVGSCLLENGVVIANGDSIYGEITCGIQGRIG